MVDACFEIGQIAADQIQLGLVEGSRARCRAEKDLANRIRLSPGDSSGIKQNSRDVLQIGYYFFS